jgi:hypothetical protein
VPFDRTLPIPLQTPRLTLRQTAVLVGMGTIAGLAGLGSAALTGLGPPSAGKEE